MRTCCVCRKEIIDESLIELDSGNEICSEECLEIFDEKISTYEEELC